VRVLVAGAGLAGLTAARDLQRAGADVTVIEARDRIGGRVHTLRDGFANGQHVEAGADLIEDSQADLLKLIDELKLERVRILRSGWGFYGRGAKGALTIRRSGPDAFERAAKLLQPEIDAYKAAGSRWDSAVAKVIGRQSAADWLERTNPGRRLAAGIRGLRGFFLADPEDLSLLMLVDQFAQGGVPGEARMYRLRDGNDALPAALARELRRPVLLNTVLAQVRQSGRGVRAVVNDGKRREMTAEYAVITLPASTLRQVRFVPALPDLQRRAIRTLEYGRATRVVLQFERRFWRRIARPLAYGSDQPIGAVWDGNEQQARSPGILTLLAGGRASRDLRGIVERGGWPAVVRRLAWLGSPGTLLTAASYTWEDDRWARGGYAVFGPEFDPALRPWLGRPAGRVAFAGEHTSVKFQGFMNGAVESGRRAALEIAMMAQLEWRALRDTRALP
jgi:monoamine oxidase